jgi:hypothetical protein
MIMDGGHPVRYGFFFGVVSQVSQFHPSALAAFFQQQIIPELQDPSTDAKTTNVVKVAAAIQLIATMLLFDSNYPYREQLVSSLEMISISCSSLFTKIARGCVIHHKYTAGAERILFTPSESMDGPHSKKFARIRNIDLAPVISDLYGTGEVRRWVCFHSRLAAKTSARRVRTPNDSGNLGPAVVGTAELFCLSPCRIGIGIGVIPSNERVCRGS